MSATNGRIGCSRKVALAIGKKRRSRSRWARTEGGRWRGAERQKSAALQATLNSAINPCRSSSETAAKKRKALGEKNRCPSRATLFGGIKQLLLLLLLQLTRT